jgi:hypothetical protein
VFGYDKDRMDITIAFGEREDTEINLRLLIKLLIKKNDGVPDHFLELKKVVG